VFTRRRRMIDFETRPTCLARSPTPPLFQEVNHGLLQQPRSMPNHLCITPLTTTTPTHQSASFLCIREENTKSSFALVRPIAWLLRETIDGEGDCREAEACISSFNITHTSSDDVSGLTTTIDESVYETFLFGGMELIANVKTMKVYAIHSSIDSTTTTTTALADAEETYLTTCKGLPMRDLSAISITPYCIDGSTTTTTTTATTGNIENGNDDEGTTKTTEPEDDELYYKFIFVLPGGPKPMKRVRLKFIAQPIYNVVGVLPSIIVRTLKVKGRLSTDKPQTKAKQPTRFSFASSSEGMNSNNILQNDFDTTTTDGQSLLMGLQCQMIPQEVQQMIPPPSSSTATPRDYSLRMNQQQQQQQHHHNINNHEQERTQAEIMSTMAGLGIFLRSSEERMSTKIETLLSRMETRINERLDNVIARIDELEMKK
jgi:hypothetical protein